MRSNKKTTKKMRILIIVGCIIALSFEIKATYSLFVSSDNLSSQNLNVAKFIFNSTKTDSIELPINDLNPGDFKEYKFSVSNNNSDELSGVLIEYRLSLKTFHFIPLNIELYSVKDNDRTLELTCDESYARVNNEIVCNGSNTIMGFTAFMRDDYVLKVAFPKEYDSEIYANLVDYISLEINSWQKID